MLRLREIAKDPLGHAYAVGTIQGGSSKDIYIVKYSPNGSILWSHSWNGSFGGDDDGYGIAVDAFQNIYVCGSIQSASSDFDFAVRKYLKPTNQNDHDYTVDWNYTYGGGTGQEQARAIVLDSSRNSYVAGSVMRSGNLDAAIVKLTSGGALAETAWDEISSPPHPKGMRLFSGGGEQTDIFYSAALDGDWVLATGSRIDGTSPSFDTKTLTARVRRTDGFVKYATAYAPSGTASSPNVAYSVVPDGSGNAYVCGSTNHSNYNGYALTIKIDEDGNVCWHSAIRDELGENIAGAEARQIVYNPAASSVYIVGLAFGTSTGETRGLFVAKYSKTAPNETCQTPVDHSPGAHKAEARQNFHGVDPVQRVSISLDPFGNVFAIGTKTIARRVGTGEPAVYYNRTDYFVAVYDPCLSAKLFDLAHGETTHSNGSEEEEDSRDQPGAAMMILGNPFHAWAAGTSRHEGSDRGWAVRHCWRQGDANFDGVVDDTDLAVVIGCWGIEQACHEADINRDGIVDDIDLAIVLENFGEQCP